MSPSDLPRVLHVVPSVGRQSGGLTSAVVGLAAALQDQGAETSIHTTDAATPPQAKLTRRGLNQSDLPDRFNELDITLYPMREPYRLSFAPKMLASLKREAWRFDLIHIHGLFLFPQFASYHAARSSGTPFVVSTHGMLSGHLRQRGKLRKQAVDLVFQERMLRQASALHAVSETERVDLEELRYGPQVQVIPNGLDLSAFAFGVDGERFRAAHGIASGIPVIMSHGRLNHVKGLDILIDAFAITKKTFKDALLVLVGPDDEGMENLLRDRAGAVGIQDSVMFAGALGGQQLKDAIAAADVWSLMSHSDSFGLAALEAMALGKAVVASHHVGITPVASRADALVMTDANASEAADAFNWLLNDPPAREALGARAQRFSKRFDWPVVAKQFINLYEGILAGR